MDGVVNVHKTAGPTSHDVVDQLRRIFGQKRVGHAGTLDPMATGVLVVCLGQATRIVEYLTSTEKEYRAVMTLGVTTDTQDSTGEIISESDASGLTIKAIKVAVESFVGEIEQIPPMISAIKHEGKPLYKHAREGRIIDRAPRRVIIHSIDVSIPPGIIPPAPIAPEFIPPGILPGGGNRVGVSIPPGILPGGGRRAEVELSIPPGILPGGETRAEVELTVRCSSGTYIRTLCADIGEALGCGGMMSKLERTRVGRFSIDEATTVAELEGARAEGRLSDYVCSIASALDDMPAAHLDAEGERRVLHGLAVPADEAFEIGDPVTLLSPSGELVAIGYAAEIDGARVIKPRKVLADASQ